MSEFPQDAPGFQEGPLNAAGAPFRLIEQNLLALQAAPGDLETLKATFRGLRSITGVPGFPELDQAQALASAGEKVLSALREGRIKVNAQVIELLFETGDLLRILVVKHVDLHLRGQEAPLDPDSRSLIARLESLLEA